MYALFVLTNTSTKKRVTKDAEKTLAVQTRRGSRVRAPVPCLQEDGTGQKIRGVWAPVCSKIHIGKTSADEPHFRSPDVVAQRKPQ